MDLHSCIIEKYSVLDLALCFLQIKLVKDEFGFKVILYIFGFVLLKVLQFYFSLCKVTGEPHSR